MNKKHFNSYLDSIAVPDVKTPTQKEKLRQALLATAFEKNSNSNVRVKGGEQYNMRRILLTVTSALVVSVVLLGMSLFYPAFINTPQAQAKDLVDRVIFKVADLSPEERKAIEQKIQDDLMESLKEAKAAKDLRIVPESEIERIALPENGGKDLPAHGMRVFKLRHEDIAQDGKEPSHDEVKITEGAVPGRPVVPTSVKTVLEYTDTQGRKTTLGLDEHEKPVMKMIKLEAGKMPDGKGFGTEPVRFEFFKKEEK
jgi:hypothetical protein